MPNPASCIQQEPDHSLLTLTWGMPHTGEYPMTGTSAAEKEIPGSRADKLHRGRNVVLAFTMQVGSPRCPPPPPPAPPYTHVLGSCSTGNIMQQILHMLDLLTLHCHFEAPCWSRCQLLRIPVTLAVNKREEVVRLPVACYRSVTGAGLGSTCQSGGADGGAAGL